MTNKERVEHCLKIDEESRNSDKRLHFVIIWEYFKNRLFEHNFKWCISFEDMQDDDVPSLDKISRVRRAVQAKAYKKVMDGCKDYLIYLPTRQEVMEARRKNEKEWAKFVGLR